MSSAQCTTGSEQKVVEEFGWFLPAEGRAAGTLVGARDPHHNDSRGGPVDVDQGMLGGDGVARSRWPFDPRGPAHLWWIRLVMPASRWASWVGGLLGECRAEKS